MSAADWEDLMEEIICPHLLLGKENGEAELEPCWHRIWANSGLWR
jgi:hypothetical protein